MRDLTILQTERGVFVQAVWLRQDFIVGRRRRRCSRVAEQRTCSLCWLRRVAGRRRPRDASTSFRLPLVLFQLLCLSSSSESWTAVCFRRSRTNLLSLRLRTTVHDR